METSEGTKRKYNLKLSELDVKILLEALGAQETRHLDRRESTKATRVLIERIYRAIGVRL